MTNREQAVWGAAYATSPEPGEAAALHAERVARSLAEIEWQRTELPEHRAARLCFGLEFDEFKAWYPVEVKLNAPGRPPPRLTEADLRAAYDTYLRCGSDFS